MSRVQTWKNNINQSSHERFYLAKLNQNAGSTEFSQFDAWLVAHYLELIHKYMMSRIKGNKRQHLVIMLNKKFNDQRFSSYS